MESFMGLLPYISSGMVVGMVLPGLLALKIFARREEVSDLKTYMAEHYIQRSEVDRRLDRIESTLERISERLRPVV